MVITYRLLYTGFLPFGSDPTNPSGDVAREMATRRRVETAGPAGRTLVANITTRVFDVLWTMPAEGALPAQSGAADEVERAIDEVMPDIVIATGMAGDSFRVEQIAQDYDVRHQDNRGRQPATGRREFPTEPLTRDTTLPFAQIQQAWARAGVTNVNESRSAGNFICEDVFYRVMRTAADSARQARGLRIQRAGFIHVPGPGRRTTASIADTMEIAIRETMLDIPVLDDRLDDRYRPRGLRAPGGDRA